MFNQCVLSVLNIDSIMYEKVWMVKAIHALCFQEKNTCVGPATEG